MIRDKLSFVFEERSEQLTQSARRQKAYAEMADLQVMEIIRTMRTYSRNNGENTSDSSSIDNHMEEEDGQEVAFSDESRRRQSQA